MWLLRFTLHRPSADENDFSLRQSESTSVGCVKVDLARPYAWLPSSCAADFRDETAANLHTVVVEFEVPQGASFSFDTRPAYLNLDRVLDQIEAQAYGEPTVCGTPSLCDCGKALSVVVSVDCRSRFLIAL
jgi:hypothetical protein